MTKKTTALSATIINDPINSTGTIFQRIFLMEILPQTRHGQAVQQTGSLMRPASYKATIPLPTAFFYLSTASTLATTAQWEFYVDLKFATSSTNYADIYLTASASDLTAIGTSGYFVRIGNTADEICLYRKRCRGSGRC